MSDEKPKVEKTEELFDKLADQMDSIVKAITDNGNGDYQLPSIEEVEDIWKALNKKLTNLEKLDQADFVIKTSNEFYFVGMFLKAMKMQDISRRGAVLSELTQAKALGADNGFIRNEAKELTKRMQE